MAAARIIIPFAGVTHLLTNGTQNTINGGG